MKLLLDEDSQCNVLVRLLRNAGHDVETVSQAGITGSADATVLDYARHTGRVLLTRNGKDFLVLHQANSQHPGILVEHQGSNLTKNMTYEQIVGAIVKLERSGWSCEGELVAINAWQ